ncbi:hypothetical protein NFI96_000398 [Prochilodus magdalenae]|nr:hypothetical protein NFI96_000398 [Prochilodus magdalenae]
MCLDSPSLSEGLIEQLHLFSDLHSVEVSLTVEEGWTDTPVDLKLEWSWILSSLSEMKVLMEDSVVISARLYGQTVVTEPVSGQDLSLLGVSDGEERLCQVVFSVQGPTDQGFLRLRFSGLGNPNVGNALGWCFLEGLTFGDLDSEITGLNDEQTGASTMCQKNSCGLEKNGDYPNLNEERHHFQIGSNFTPLSERRSETTLQVFIL